MKKGLFAYKNVKGGFYKDPFVASVSKEEYPEAFRQMCFCAPIEQLKTIEDDDLFCVGEMDNITGVITPCNEFILHCADIVAAAVNVRIGEVKKDA